MNAVTEAVRDVIGQSEQPMRYYEIAHHPDVAPLIVEPDDVHCALRDLTKAGELRRVGKGAYRYSEHSTREESKVSKTDPVRLMKTPDSGREEPCPSPEGQGDPENAWRRRTGGPGRLYLGTSRG